MAFLEILVVFAWYLCLSLLSWLGLHRAWLQWAVRSVEEIPPAPDPEEWPPVLVQLPIYNEPAVAVRVLRHAAAMRRVSRIQVLDDSTDETTVLVAEEVSRLRTEHPELRIEHIRRGTREGFKAGALAHGMASSDEPFVVIFDADFCPQVEFVERALPVLMAGDYGFVQARWGHINRTSGALTRAQAALLDGHFRREHRVRSGRGLMFNFNGTAGIWRREAIEAAGGWQHDTLTEDLDLSWRAYLAGWRFAYLDRLVAAELPDSWRALRGQQSRWTRGSLQCLRKLWWPVLRAPLPLSVRLEAMVPLVANLAWLLVFALIVLSFPVFILRQEMGLRGLMWLDLAFLLPCTVAFYTFYYGVMREAEIGRWRCLFDALLALLLGIGLCVNNTRSALSGLLGGEGTFVRTPKRGEGPRRAIRAATLLPLLELVLALYLVVLLWLVVSWQVLIAAPFVLLFMAGLLWASLGTLRG